MLAQPQTVFYRAWARTSATLEEDFTNHVATLAAPSGETFVAGSTKNDNDTYSMILSKYQASGMLAWEAEFTVNDAGNVHVGNMALDASGNILVVGSAYNGSTNGYDLLLVKFDDSGNFLLAGPSARISGREILTVKYARHTLVLPADEGVAAPFVENRGQVLNTDLEPEDDIRYYTRSMYPNVYIFDGQVSYVFAHIDTVPASTDTMARIDLTFIGLQPNREGVAVGLERQDYHHNYYLGHIPEGRERVALENKVLQPAIYQNIDALYGQGPDGLFIRLICRPGSDPDEVRLQFDGHTGIWVDTATGMLVLETALEPLVLPAPEAMTIDDEGVETLITAWQPAYVVGTGGVVSITTGSYDTSGTLVVKVGRERGGEFTALSWWSTYYGWTSYDTKAAVDIDEQQGRIYTCGQSRSKNFPVGQFVQSAMGECDWAINRFSFSGVPEWFTMIGGEGVGNGDFRERANDISVGSGEFLYVGGRAVQWPTGLFKNPNGGYQNTTYGSGITGRGAVVKMKKEDGIIEWSTYFGDGGLLREEVLGVRALGSGGVAVVGYAHGGTNPTSQWQNVNPGGGAHQQTFGDMYMGVFGANDQLLWATKFGPENDLPNDSNAPTDIVEDGLGNLFVVGVVVKDNTSNDNFPSGGGLPFTPGNKDGFAAKFSTNRALTWVTYIGGTGYDYCSGVACDLNTNNIIVAGTTFSTQGFPIVNVGNSDLDDGALDGASDLFLAKFSNNGILLHSRFFGGSGNERTDEFALSSQESQPGNALVVDADGNIFVTGSTTNGLPVLWPTPHPAWYFPDYSGSTDAFVAAFASNFKLEYCTYLGGTGEDVGTGLDVVTLGARHYIVTVGRTRSVAHDYPTAQETLLTYYNSTYQGGQYDGVITKIITNSIIVDLTEAERFMGGIVLAPNPCTDVLRIQFLDPADHSEGEVSVCDLTGRVVLRVSLLDIDRQGFVNTKSLPDGTYVLHISHPKGNWVRKFIKLK